MIHRWYVPLPVNSSDKTRLEELKQAKLGELEQEMKLKTSYEKNLCEIQDNLFRTIKDC